MIVLRSLSLGAPLLNARYEVVQYHSINGVLRLLLLSKRRRAFRD